MFLKAHGYTVCRLPTLQAPFFRVGSPPIVSSTASKDLVKEIGDRGNDHIDTEMGLFICPDRNEMVFLVNSSYLAVFREQVEEAIAKIREKTVVRMVIVPNHEEQFLPANLIQCPDGSIIINGNAKETIGMINDVSPETILRPIQVVSSGLSTRTAGGLRCSVNTSYLPPT
ncbi:hypothetical protein KA012_02090 [Candidatus Woesebacteria bacterium]|nr:hypothetical protein [Candidatus Woesebacteria bacterium]